jgi:Uri superfamily endonuclease
MPTIRSRNSSGSYVLVLRLRSAIRLTVGSLGEREFPAGFYAYCGSALGGFRPRLLRHVSRKKTARWHVDYLTNKAAVASIVIFESKKKLECALASALGQRAAGMARFGCSDCDCTSHLFFAPSEEEIMTAVDDAIDRVREPSTVLARRDIAGYLGLKRR